MGKRLRCGRRGAWNTHGIEPKLRDAYFNHHVYRAETRWQRREFVGKWRRINAKDPRWRAPYAPSLRRELLDPAAHLIYVDALPTKATLRGSSLETSVAAAVIRRDPLRRDTGYLSFLHSVNDHTTFRVLLESLSEHLRPHGIRTLLGPTHLFPHLGSGVLTSHWSLPPPRYTPYNPPYLGELCQILMKPVENSRLYHLSTDVQVKRESSATFSPLEPERLTGDLLPLLQAACSANPAFSPPNIGEAEKMLRWMSVSPRFGLMAEVEGQPVGMALLQPDVTPGSLLSRLRFRGRQEVGSGRLLFWGVLPEFRQRGIGRHLLLQSLEVAREGGWQALSLGPLPSPTGKLLAAWGAEPRQGYTLYHYTL